MSSDAATGKAMNKATKAVAAASAAPSASTKAPSVKKPHTDKTAYPLIAIIRIRGNVGRSHEMNRTFMQLNLNNQNTCVIVPGTPAVRGMLRRLEGFCTWGRISADVKALIEAKRKPERENVYRLSPPIHGYGRKGIKVSFKQKGALGERKEKIDDLLKRMI